MAGSAEGKWINDNMHSNKDRGQMRYSNKSSEFIQIQTKRRVDDTSTNDAHDDKRSSMQVTTMSNVLFTRGFSDKISRKLDQTPPDIKYPNSDLKQIADL